VDQYGVRIRVSKEIRVYRGKVYKDKDMWGKGYLGD
jgi:hypothetical protein